MKQRHRGVMKRYTLHPACNWCTLYFDDDLGFGVVQQYYNKNTKETAWGPIQGSYVNDIYLHKDFKSLFEAWAKPIDELGNYPIYTLRQVMHALKMKPLKKELWETVFDHKPI